MTRNEYLSLVALVLAVVFFIFASVYILAQMDDTTTITIDND